MAKTPARILSFIFLIGYISAAKHPRIIGGNNAEIQEFPYVVSIRFFGEDFCGGSIISERHILTAAHCMDAFSKDLVRVHSGTSKSNEKGNIHKILSVHSHPKWGANEAEYSDDIAVLTLESPIVFNKHQHKINLPSHDVQDYQQAYLLGWGRDANWNTDHPKQFQKLRVALLRSEKCEPFVTSKITQNQLCAYSSANTGFCYGDGGGPLVSHGEIVGIASFIDKEECASGINDIYTNVFAYKDFIESVIYG